MIKITHGAYIEQASPRSEKLKLLSKLFQSINLSINKAFRMLRHNVCVIK